MSKGNIIPSYDLYKTLDSRIGFEFTKLEEAYNPYNAALPHRHNYYEILFFQNSGGTHDIDFTTYPILGNSLHFISPEQVHQLKRDKHVTGYVISFTKEFCYEDGTGTTFIDSLPFFSDPDSAPVVQTKPGKQQMDIPDVIEKIKSEYFSTDEGTSKVLSSYLTILLIAAKRMYEPKNGSGKTNSVHNELIRKFKLLVEKNFLKEKSVSVYAELLNITAGHLNDTTQREIGKTASDIIHERVILEAKRLLYHSEKSVKEIAYALHYDDPSYFIKFFKLHTEMTPEHFRTHVREKYH